MHMHVYTCNHPNTHVHLGTYIHPYKQNHLFHNYIIDLLVTICSSKVYFNNQLHAFHYTNYNYKKKYKNFQEILSELLGLIVLVINMNLWFIDSAVIFYKKMVLLENV